LPSNAQAVYDTATYGRKKFIVQTPGACIIKLITALINYVTK